MLIYIYIYNLKMIAQDIDKYALIYQLMHKNSLLIDTTKIYTIK